MKTLIVSGADSAFFRLLQGTFLSLKAQPGLADIALGAYDCGLAPEEVAWLEGEGAVVVDPGWDIRLRDPAAAKPKDKAFLSRPFIPRHFPGYDLYLWMDADTWVQDAAAVRLYLDSAKDGAIAITPEVDRAYERHGHDLKWRSLFGIPLGVTSYMYRRYRRAWGREAALRWSTYPIMNSGVFAARGDAPHWQAWAKAFQDGHDNYRNALRRNIDQAALNYVVYEQDLPRAYLPAWCNWLTALATPLFDRESGMLLETHPPYHRLGIVHLNHEIKYSRLPLCTTGGGSVERTLLYRDGNY